MRRLILTSLLALVFVGTWASAAQRWNVPCPPSDDQVAWQTLASLNCKKLSHYGLFTLKDGEAVFRGQPFQPRNALFTDYATKDRFILIPDNKTLHVSADGSQFRFPLGTVLVKNFYLENKKHSSSTLQLIETRLLILREQGWLAMPYIWHGDDATLRITGGAVAVSNAYGEFNYLVPDMNQCRTCHNQKRDGKVSLLPIGFTPANLNFELETGKNQLHRLIEKGLLEINPEEFQNIPSRVNMHNNKESLFKRAKAYLDINCAHCHSDEGHASLSGLRLDYEQPVDYLYGICNDAHGWDGGSEGLQYDIVPGNTKLSAMVYRLKATHRRDAMPPLGRSLVDSFGVELISEWIDSLPTETCN